MNTLFMLGCGLFCVLDFLLKTSQSEELDNYRFYIESRKEIIVCAGLNRYGSHRLLCLNAWPVGRDTTRRCGLVGVGVPLLE